MAWQADPIAASMRSGTGTWTGWQPIAGTRERCKVFLQLLLKYIFSCFSLFLGRPNLVQEEAFYSAVSAPGISLGEPADDPGKRDGCFS